MFWVVPNFAAVSEYAASTPVYLRKIRTGHARQPRGLLLIHLDRNSSRTSHGLEFRSGAGPRNRRLRTPLLAHFHGRCVGSSFHRGHCPGDHARGSALIHNGTGRLFPPHLLRDFACIRHQDRFLRHELQLVRGGRQCAGSGFVQRLLSASGARPESNGQELGNADGIRCAQSRLPGILG
jgi:hypothetical protein